MTQLIQPTIYPSVLLNQIFSNQKYTEFSTTRNLYILWIKELVVWHQPTILNTVILEHEQARTDL